MKAAPSTAVSLLSWKYWPYYLAALLVILLVIALILLIRWRRRRRAARGATGEADAPARARLNLKRTWRAFLKNMPREFRHSVVLYQPYVVVGAAGSGKSELIDHCLDWEGQAAQFHPSFTDDPLVQIYHGRDALVQEISVVLLGDISPRTRSALIKLWKPLRRGKQPRAVVVIDAAGLRSDPPEVLTRHAQLIRGKLNVLSHVLRRPVKTTIALTHLDQFSGYLELVNLLSESRTSLAVNLDGERSEEELDRSLRPFDRFVPLALTTRPAREYLNTLAFLKTAPELLGRLSIFLDALKAPDPATFAPAVERICFTSNKEPYGVGANPLSAAITDEDVLAFRPLRKHRIIAAAALAAGIAYLGGAYLREEKIIGEACRQADELTERTRPLYPGTLRDRFFSYVAAHRGGGLAWLLPSYHTEDEFFGKREIREHLLAGIRQRILFPRLGDPSEMREVAHVRRPLYSLALLYGTESNDLGALIQSNLSHWEDVLEVPERLIRDCLKHREAEARFDLPFDARRLEKAFTLPGGADYSNAESFFAELAQASRATHIQRSQLRRLQRNAVALLGDVANIDRNRMLAEILELLERETGVTLAASWRRRISGLPQITLDAMKQLVLVLKAYEIPEVEMKSVALGRLIADVKALSPMRDKLGIELRFSVGGQRYDFRSAEWHDLIRRSRATALIKEFAAAKTDDPIGAFFPPRVDYRGLSLGHAGTVFVSNGKVNGLLTRKAFEDQVKPALEEVPALLKLLEELPVPTEEREDFAEFLVQTMEEYADRYVEEYSQYYRAFRYRVGSASALDYLLTQLQSPGSPLKKLLAEIEKNTNLDLEEGSRFVDPMLQVQSTFSFLQSVVVKPKGGASGLDNFAAIIAKMQATLASKDDAVDEGDEAGALKSKLSPLGRVAFAIYRDAEDSYYRQVESWMNAVGVLSQWKEPFIGPPREAYRLGLREINSVVAEIWQKLSEEYVDPLRTAFPFDPHAEVEVSVSQVTDALSPKKAFWTAFNSYLAPFCSQRLGRYRRRPSRFQQVNLPADLLARANDLVRLRGDLLDDKGNPRPLTLAIKPVLLPVQKVGVFSVVLAFLQVGDSAIYAFNQQPSWQEISIRWWKNETAVIGVAFAREGQAKKSYRHVTAGDSLWSFHRLLMLAATQKKKNMWTWNVHPPESNTDIVGINFTTKNDPWVPFQRSFGALQPKRTAAVGGPEVLCRDPATMSLASAMSPEAERTTPSLAAEGDERAGAADPRVLDGACEATQGQGLMVEGQEPPEWLPADDVVETGRDEA